MSTGVTGRHIGVWLAAAVCLVPTANSNIRPYWESGAWGVVINQAAFVLFMATLPLIASLVRSWPLKLCCYLLAAGLFSYSLYNAVHMGHRTQEAATSPARTILAKDEAYKSQIVNLEAQRRAITSKPGYKTVGEESIKTAKAALDAATNAGRGIARARAALEEVCVPFIRIPAQT